MATRALCLWIALTLLATPAFAANPYEQPGTAATGTANLTGQLLVASQRLTEPSFARTVIYLIAYSEQGAMGVIVNRLIGQTSYRKLLGAFGIKSRANKPVSVYYGGPVDIGRGLIIHSPDYLGASTQQLGQQLAVSTGPDVLQDMAKGKGPSLSRLTLGYAGWGAGQLDREIDRGDWLIAPAEPALIFSDDVDGIWAKALFKAVLKL